MKPFGLYQQGHARKQTDQRLLPAREGKRHPRRAHG
jgi:hypothetical protein